MRIRQLTRRPGIVLYPLLTIALAAPSWAEGAEPLETIRAAFRASSDGLISGAGKGKYRRYEALPGKDWELKVEADVSTYFAGSKYHIDLNFLRDGLRGNTSARSICDGKLVTITWFSPSIHPIGAHTIVEAPTSYGRDLCPPEDGTFPWDVAHLSGHVWNGYGLLDVLNAGRIDFAETSEGDLIGIERTRINRSQTRMECPGRFGFNVARVQYSVEGEDHPRIDYAVQWKQHPSGLWYVTSFQNTFDLPSSTNKLEKRVREVLMYSRFRTECEGGAGTGPAPTKALLQQGL